MFHVTVDADMMVKKCNSEKNGIMEILAISRLQNVYKTSYTQRRLCLES